MNANLVGRSGRERRLKNMFFAEEVRRMGTDRRQHGKTAEDLYDSLWHASKDGLRRIFGVSRS